jgi:hypothetical protein
MVNDNRPKHAGKLSERSIENTAEGERSKQAGQLGESAVVSHMSGVEAHDIFKGDSGPAGRDLSKIEAVKMEYVWTK